MELVVVMGIFSIAVTMATGIFLLSNRAQRRVLAVTSAEDDLRFALEAVAREVRAGKIDYATYASSGNVSIPAAHLYVIGASGQKEDFYVETSPAYCPTATPKCLVVRFNGGTPQPVTAAGDSIEKLGFYIAPQADPFSLGQSGLYNSNRQPTVTIAMQARVVNVGAADQVTFAAQTTVESRVYAR